MKNRNFKPAPPLPVAGEAPSSDWFYDELMTAQPEATREFMRARLLRAAPGLIPKNRN